MDVKNETVKIIMDVCEHLTIEESDFDKTLDQVGVDSLDLSSVLLEIEEKFGIDISDEDIEQFETINKIAEYVLDKKA